VFLDVEGGTLAYEVAGSGPLVVLAHGMGDSRRAYRFMTPALVEAGYRVAAVDLRGCGESSVEWPGYSRTDVAGDLIALVEHLGGGPAILVGHSLAGGAATIAAASEPSLVAAVIELAPFTRGQQIRLGDFKVGRFRRGTVHLLVALTLGSASQWRRYLDEAYPGPKPADWDARCDEIDAMLREPGRMKVLQKMGQSKPTDAGAQLSHVSCPVLVIEGSEDPDWADPEAEGKAIVAELPAGLGHLEILTGAGHYPHVQFPQQLLDSMRSFLARTSA
jgi:pimeloyl-ACP methyl ester carboxylesterase